MPRALLLTFLLAALTACGSSSRSRSPDSDGGTTGRDAGDRPRDGAAEDTGDLMGEPCGSTVCTGAEVCCVDCDGAPMGCGMACPGIACPSDCRSDADCTSGSETCLPPGVPPACGIGCAMMRDCESHADCGEGLRCVEMVGPCCSAADPLESRCLPACAPGSCPEGQRCNADAICEPTPCADGYTCPAHTTCTGTGDEHGCSRNACTSDADCPSGACVSGLCYTGPGTCTPPSP